MSKRYICSRCGKQSDTNFDRHLMGHKVHPDTDPAFWIDLDFLNYLQKYPRQEKPPAATR